MPTNDPDKVIKGSEFTTEFTAIQTAFGLAAPAASPTFTGTVTIASVDINGGNIDGTTIGGTTPAAGTFSSLTATTADINGGTIDGVTIGGSSAGAITGTTGQFNTSLNVDGTVTADGLTVDGSTTTKTISGSTAPYSAINYTNTTSSKTYRVGSDESGNFKVRNTTDNRNAIQIESNNDISFYEDTGTTPKFFWDASAEALGIGTSSPAEVLEIRKDVASTYGAKLRITNGQNFGYGSALDFAQPLTSGASPQTSARIASGYAGANDGFLAFFTTLDSSVSEAMRIDSSGNVGIGTSSPSGNLHVDGGEVFFTSTGNSKLQIKAGNTSSSFIEFGDPDDGNVGRLLYSHSDNSMQFTVNASERMRIDSSGNLLVGTASVPSGGVQKFSVKQTGGDLSSTTVTRANMTGIITADADSPTNNYGNGIWFNSGSLMAGIASTRVTTGNWGTDLRFYTHPTTTSNVDETYERMRINSSGDVGIGTSSPAYKLDVSGSIGVTGLFVNKGSTGTIAQFGGADTDVLNIDGGSDVVTLDARNVSALTFERQGSEAMRIDSSGKLLINTTSETTPGNNSAYLIVESDSGAAQEGIYIRSDGGAGDPAFVVGDASNVAQLNIYGDGDVENTNGTYGTISDARVKENITDAGSQWDDFKALRIRKYNLISKPDEPHIGVIAQELEEAGMAGLVKETRQDGMKSVKTSILYMKAIKALQEAMERIEALEAEVAALKGA